MISEPTAAKIPMLAPVKGNTPPSTPLRATSADEPPNTCDESLALAKAAPRTRAAIEPRDSGRLLHGWMPSMSASASQG